MDIKNRITKRLQPSRSTLGSPFAQARPSRKLWVGGSFTQPWQAYELLSRHLLTILAIWLFACLITAISTFIFMPINSTNAVTPSETIDGTPTIAISSSDIDFGGINATNTGAVKTATNTATISSSIYGYELYISSSNNSNALIRSGTAGTDPSEIIPATSTTDITAPSVLSNDTWGFAVQRRNTTTNSGSEDVIPTATFDNTYPTGDSSNPSNKFIALPTLDNKVLIAERESSATNVPTNIYYGVRATTDKTSGLYQGSVTYTAIGKAPTTHTVTIKTAPGISRVTIGETECTSSEGCDVTLTYGYSYSLTATTTSGYTFNQWSLSNSIGAFTDGSSTSTTSSSATTTFIAGKGSTTITPNATANTYYLSLNNQSATSTGSTAVYYRYNTATFYTASNLSTTMTKIITPSRAGYTFGGYYTSTNGNGTQYITADGSFTNNPQNLMGNPTTLYAKWTINSYTLTVKYGTGVSSVTVGGTNIAHNGIINLNYNQTYDIDVSFGIGYEFSSWSATSGVVGSDSTKATTYRIGAGAATLTANAKTDNTSQGQAIATINADVTTGTLNLSNIITMQQFSSSVCDAMKKSTTSSNTNKNYTLKDGRDNKTYNVAKLDDNICRMVQNLRLGSSSTITLTFADSDVSSNWTTPAVQTSGSSSWDVSSKHIYQQSDTNYGNLYNWYTATAGTGTSDMVGSDASSSICPKGWKLPPDLGFGSYEDLINATGITDDSAGSAKIRSAPYSFPFAGAYGAGLYNQGSQGIYWSRTAHEHPSYSNSVRLLDIRPNTIGPRGFGYKDTGYSVRCYYAG